MHYLQILAIIKLRFNHFLVDFKAANALRNGPEVNPKVRVQFSKLFDVLYEIIGQRVDSLFHRLIAMLRLLKITD